MYWSQGEQRWERFSWCRHYHLGAGFGQAEVCKRETPEPSSLEKDWGRWALHWIQNCWVLGCKQEVVTWLSLCRPACRVKAIVKGHVTWTGVENLCEALHQLSGWFLFHISIVSRQGFYCICVWVHELRGQDNLGELVLLCRSRDPVLVVRYNNKTINPLSHWAPLSVEINTLYHRLPGMILRDSCMINACNTK